MENKLNDKELKITRNSFIIIASLVVINGLISQYRPWTEPIVHAIILSGIPYIYYTIASTIMNENYLHICKSTKWRYIYEALGSIVLEIILLYKFFYSSNHMAITAFITNNQLNSKFGILLLLVFNTYIAIIAFINYQKFKHQDAY